MGYYQTNHSESRTGTASRTRRNAYPRHSQARLGRRLYNPTTGRWLNEDPVGIRGGLNLYVFVGNNSAQVVDAMGLSWVACSVRALASAADDTGWTPAGAYPAGSVQNIGGTYVSQGAYLAYKRVKTWTHFCACACPNNTTKMYSKTTYGTMVTWMYAAQGATITWGGLGSDMPLDPSDPLGLIISLLLGNAAWPSPSLGDEAIVQAALSGRAPAGSVQGGVIKEDPTPKRLCLWP